MTGGGDIIGRARYLTEVDPSGVDKGLDEASRRIKDSGDATERTATERASRATAKLGAITKAGMVALSGAVAGAMAVATRGAVQMEQAQADFQAETGASAEEAKRFGQAVNDMSARNVQSLEEIVAAGTKVRTDLGLTGDEADRTTQSFLAYARATRQDASGAVLAFDDILDAWNLTAGDAQGIMDQLVASHQRYGGSIEDNQAALASMAPALQAMNLSVDDGIGLLNLFAANGLDASVAQRALNTAITKLPKGESLKGFLERIGSIEDPTLRAREAVKVFGSQAGPRLANAIAPGKDALDDYVVMAEDVPGATEMARDAMDSTFGTRFQLLMNEATAAVRGLGMEFGPAGALITAVTSAAPLLSAPLRKLFAATGADQAVRTAATVAGARLGGLMGAAAAAGLGTAILAGIILLAVQHEREIQQAGRDIRQKLFGDAGASDGGMLAGTILDSLGDGINAFADSLDQNNPLIDGVTKAYDRILQAGVDGLDTAAQERAFQEKLDAIFAAAAAAGGTPDEIIARATRDATAYLGRFGVVLGDDGNAARTENVLAGFLSAAQGADPIHGPFGRAGQSAGIAYLASLGGSVLEGYDKAVNAAMTAAMAGPDSTPESVRLAGQAGGQRYLGALGEIIVARAGAAVGDALTTALQGTTGADDRLAAAGAQQGRTLADALAAATVDRLRAVHPALEAASDDVGRTIDDFIAEWDRFGSLEDPGLAALVAKDNALIRAHYDQLPEDIRPALQRFGITTGDALTEGPTAAIRQWWSRGELIHQMQDSSIKAGVALDATLRSILPGAFAPWPEHAELANDETVEEILRGGAAMVRAVEATGGNLRDAVEQAGDDLQAARDDRKWMIANPNAWRKQLREVEDALDNSQRRLERAREGGNQRQIAIETAFQGQLTGTWEGLTGQAYQNGVRITRRRGKGMRDGDGKGGPTDEAEASDRRIRQAMAGARRRARIEGALTSEELANGLRSKNPLVRGAAAQAKATLITQWEAATGLSWDHGKGISANLARGMRQNRGRPAEEARGIKGGVDRVLSAAPAVAYKDGERVSSQFAAGIAARTREVTGAAVGVTRALWNAMHQESPAKEGPLSEDGGTHGWGMEAGRLFATGLLASRSEVAGAAAMVLSPLASMSRGGGPRLSLETSATQTVRHEHGGSLRIDLTERGARALREAGYSGRDIRDLAGTIDLGRLSEGLERRNRLQSVSYARQGG